MARSERSSRSVWLVVGLLFVGSCLPLAWCLDRNAWPDLQAYFEATRDSGRTSRPEAALDHARYKRQIRSIIELAADDIRQLGGTCSQSAVKGENILDEIDLSNWHGKDPDLTLLRFFLKQWRIDDVWNDGLPQVSHVVFLRLDGSGK